MFTREELLRGKSHWLIKIQNKLFNLVDEYLENNNLSRTDFAKKLGVTKGYISQILNGDFNHTISKMIELSLAIGKAPVVEFIDLEKYILADKFDVIHYSEKEQISFFLNAGEFREKDEKIKIEKAYNITINTKTKISLSTDSEQTHEMIYA